MIYKRCDIYKKTKTKFYVNSNIRAEKQYNY
jgi:hypothetical protein